MKYLAALVPVILAASFTATSRTIVHTDAYRWDGDSIIQGDARAWAVSPYEIQSTYHPQPGYYMGIKPEWKLKNDISSYPRLETPDLLHTALYNMALDEMVNAVEPDTTLRTGAAWGGVWTRDISYSIILSMAYMQPRASRISLMRKVDPMGRIIQDTGSGGAWPVSTDRAVWIIAAWELYKATGDRDWLAYAHDVATRSLADDVTAALDPASGLFRGETSFIDWREQSHPRWMQCADIAETRALGTNMVFKRALDCTAMMEREAGNPDGAARWETLSADVARGINRYLWMPDKGYYAMYLYGGDNLIQNPRAETLGESLAILWDAAPAVRADSITRNNPTTPFGAAIFYPQIADIPPYHNNALWPWVASFWAMANAKAGNEQGVVEAIGSVARPAALFCTNKENFVLDNGDIATQLNSSNMLWCLAGNIALTHKILFGIGFEADGLSFAPFVPEALSATRTLRGFRYRDATLDITVSGHGNRIGSFKLDGVETTPLVSPTLTGHHTVDITMSGKPIAPMEVNHRPNLKAPLTPVAWFEGNTLCWNPVEYIERYEVLRDGEVAASVTTTTFDASAPGEYSVVAVAADGTRSFASQPRSNRPRVIVPIPGEGTAVTSPEVLFAPVGEVEGYTGSGFYETDHKNNPDNITVRIDAPGEYMIRLRYANGNGPVYTGNSCAVRCLTIDGRHAGTIVMPHRGEGNWNDWGLSTGVRATLTPGQHTLGLELCVENINVSTNHALIDHIEITKM